MSDQKPTMKVDKATSIYVRKGKTGAADNINGISIAAQVVLDRALNAAGVQEGEEYQIEITTEHVRPLDGGTQ